MDVMVVTSVEKYTDRVEELLLKNEACNNLMLGILDRLVDGEQAYKGGYYLGLVVKDEKAVYAFMQTPPNNWIFADVDGLDSKIMEGVAEFLYKSNLEVPGVLGPNRMVEIFINKWNQVARLKMRQLIYQVDQVNELPTVDGYLAHATDEDHSLVKKWLIQFGIEANEHISETHADQTAGVFIENQSLYLWMANDMPVSMVNRSRKTKNGVAINAVFTPDEYKGNGYATTAVAKLTENLLDEGFQFCSLYTDIANPTSNSIYKKIGYYVVGSSVVYEFKK
ncbi:GNAT family N-acetyltransferase [Virgibacillus byunsanensis]|uniref:GNAT family N-acetyltransferase n=1 Tax=Virgibacillus byunsanensis TaxID=570945 RepID=A0ABW3LI61_9BACI